MYVDSPFEICSKCGCYVLLDQTLRECATEHGCVAGDEECPLRGHFKGIDFGSPDTPDAKEPGDR